MKRSALILLAGLAAVAAPAFAPLAAQTDVDGPTALITTYHARPGMRVKFRELMAKEGVAQFEKWKKAGTIADYQALFTTYAGDSNPDLYVILKFNKFTNMGGWQKVEETYPGGLTPALQQVASIDASGTADIVKESMFKPTTKDSQFFVLQYDVLVDNPKYESYVLGYAVPQFDAWEKAGILSSYASYVNQNPAGAPWQSFILLEYSDLPGLAKREDVKTSARKELGATNPAWKKWSDDKTAVRKEKAAIPVRSLKMGM